MKITLRTSERTVSSCLSQRLLQGRQRPGTLLTPCHSKWTLTSLWCQQSSHCCVPHENQNLLRCQKAPAPEPRESCRRSTGAHRTEFFALFCLLGPEHSNTAVSVVPQTFGVGWFGVSTIPSPGFPSPLGAPNPPPLSPRL